MIKAIGEVSDIYLYKAGIAAERRGGHMPAGHVKKYTLTGPYALFREA
jgi:hypothetical protein